MTTQPPIDATDLIGGDIKEVATGDYHTLVLLRNGSVLAYGEPQDPASFLLRCACSLGWSMGRAF